MASSISISLPLSLHSLLPSFLPLSTNKPSQFTVAQKTQFPLLYHSSSSIPFSLQMARTKLGLDSLAVSYNVQVVVEEDEPEEKPEEKLLGRFRREVFRAGVIQECKRRRFFENKHDKKKRKNREPAKRNRIRCHGTSVCDKECNCKKRKREDDKKNVVDLEEGMDPTH